VDEMALNQTKTNERRLLTEIDENRKTLATWRQKIATLDTRMSNMAQRIALREEEIALTCEDTYDAPNLEIDVREIHGWTAKLGVAAHGSRARRRKT
jgi:uncharacterized protein (DUF3084 family)